MNAPNERRLLTVNELATEFESLTGRMIKPSSIRWLAQHQRVPVAGRQSNRSPLFSEFGLRCLIDWDARRQRGDRLP